MLARVKLKGIGGEAPQGVKPAVQLDNAGKLTGGDSRMKVRLTTLPDKLSGGAWPSPVRAVRCPVKSGNERDPHA